MEDQKKEKGNEYFGKMLRKMAFIERKLTFKDFVKLQQASRCIGRVNYLLLKCGVCNMPKVDGTGMADEHGVRPRGNEARPLPRTPRLHVLWRRGITA